MYGARRCRVLLGAVLTLFLGHAAFAAAGHPLNDTSRTYLSAVRWPRRGQARVGHTLYTDPSGFDPGTVSTAADQLRVFQQAMLFPVFRQIVLMPSVTLPLAGTLTNFNPLIAEGYAGKTGSDSAAEGCLAFFTHVTVGGDRLTAVGVVMGQGQGSDTPALLAAAGEAAAQLVDSDATGPARRSAGVNAITTHRRTHE
ncbi:MAG TPA: hypothetical protein VIK04_18325 [Solirubrobacteraceae bacterium]